MKRSDTPTLGAYKVGRVALCGGTHGNELTGVTVVRRYQAVQSGSLAAQASLENDTPEIAPRWAGPGDPGHLPVPRQPETFSLEPIISNPEAVRQNRRFVDFDLNRSFGNTSLAAFHGAGYEAQRAHVLNALLGPKGTSDPATQFIIDLHTTTARLGPTVIIRESDMLARIIAAFVVSELPEVRIMSYLAEDTSAEGGEAPPPAGGAPGAADSPGDYPYLAEVAPHGIEVEVGPVPNGVIRAETVIWTEKIVNSCTSALDQWNRDGHMELPDTITVYRYREVVDYPRDIDGEIVAFVHPSRQDRDFEAITAGSPLFLHFDGSVVGYEGSDVRYPVFINEAAYYEKRAAMTLCERREIPVR